VSVYDIYSFGDSLVYLTRMERRGEAFVIGMGRFVPGSASPVPEREYVLSARNRDIGLIDERHFFYSILDQKLVVLRQADEEIVAQVPLLSPCVPLAGLTPIAGWFMTLVCGDGKCLPHGGPRGWAMLTIAPSSFSVTPLPQLNAANPSHIAGRLQTLSTHGKAYVSIKRESRTDIYEVGTASADGLVWVGSCSFLGVLEDADDERFLMVGTDTVAIVRRGERAEWR
jgi:hypothetical protein